MSCTSTEMPRKLNIRLPTNSHLLGSNEKLCQSVFSDKKMQSHRVSRYRLVGTSLCNAAGMPTNLSRTVSGASNVLEPLKSWHLSLIATGTATNRTENNPTDYKVRMVDPSAFLSASTIKNVGSSMNEPHLHGFQSSLYKSETQAPVAAFTTGKLMVQSMN